MTHLASAVFNDHQEAQHAIDALRRAGVSDDSLSVIARHGDETTSYDADGAPTEEDHSNLIRGILGGGALGAGLGVAALAIPGVGPLVAAGAIASTAVPAGLGIGAAAGAAAGTLNEALKEHGVDDEDAAYYDREVRNGRVFVSVEDETSLRREEVEELLYRYGGHSARRSRIAEPSTI